MKQGMFFEPDGVGAYGPSQEQPVRLNSTVEPEDGPRLSAQHESILARLAAGPVSNAELSATIGLRFGARINELRDAGYRITTRRRGRGLVDYSFTEDQP